jgi:MFS family permease
MQRTSFRQLINLNAYWVGLSFMWNSLHVIILPAVLLNYVPESQKNSYLGVLTFFGLVLAMLIQPIAGALSDRWVSRWGRRRPLMLIGTAFDFVFLAVLGWAGGLLWLALGYIGLQLSSNIAHGAGQGLLPDCVSPEQLGSASGVKNLMDMAGLVAASLLMGRLVPPDIVSALRPIAVVMAVLAAAALVTLMGVREKPSTGFKAASFETASPVPQPARPIPAVKQRAPRAYWWLIASRFAFLLGIYDIQVFAQYYVRDVIPTPNPVKLTGDLLAVITLGLIAFALLGGWLGDRLSGRQGGLAGHKKILSIAGGLGAAGCLLMMMVRTPAGLLGFGSVLGVGIGLFLTSNWALATRLAPGEAAGKFLGFTNLATAGSGAVARLTGPLIDLGNNATAGEYWGYMGMFLFGALCTLASVWLLRGVKEVQD